MIGVAKKVLLFFLLASIGLPMIAYMLGDVNMVDVSSSPEYRSVIGRTIIVQRPMLAISVSLDGDSEPEYTKLVRYPGTAGREVIKTEKVDSGSSFIVSGVLKSDSFMLFRIEYEISSTTFTETEQPNVIMRIATDKEPLTTNLGLDADYFRVED